ncbi:unnamed protein product [Amoebophrya sp. A25]|nr:unnamed protein product [Amoebophrya sp. A25]|eukprot:GSA25T00011839001.1
MTPAHQPATRRSAYLLFLKLIVQILLVCGLFLSDAASCFRTISSSAATTILHAAAPRQRPSLSLPGIEKRGRSAGGRAGSFGDGAPGTRGGCDASPTDESGQRGFFCGARAAGSSRPSTTLSTPGAPPASVAGSSIELVPVGGSSLEEEDVVVSSIVREAVAMLERTNIVVRVTTRHARGTEVGGGTRSISSSTTGRSLSRIPSTFLLLGGERRREQAGAGGRQGQSPPPQKNYHQNDHAAGAAGDQYHYQPSSRRSSSNTIRVSDAGAAWQRLASIEALRDPMPKLGRIREWMARVLDERQTGVPGTGRTNSSVPTTMIGRKMVLGPPSRSATTSTTSNTSTGGVSGTSRSSSTSATPAGGTTSTHVISPGDSDCASASTSWGNYRLSGARWSTTLFGAGPAAPKGKDSTRILIEIPPGAVPSDHGYQRAPPRISPTAKGREQDLFQDLATRLVQAVRRRRYMKTTTGTTWLKLARELLTSLFLGPKWASTTSSPRGDWEEHHEGRGTSNTVLLFVRRESDSSKSKESRSSSKPVVARGVERERHRSSTIGGGGASSGSIRGTATFAAAAVAAVAALPPSAAGATSKPASTLGGAPDESETTSTCCTGGGKGNIATQAPIGGPSSSSIIHCAGTTSRNDCTGTPAEQQQPQATRKLQQGGAARADEVNQVQEQEQQYQEQYLEKECQYLSEEDFLDRESIAFVAYFVQRALDAEKLHLRAQNYISNIYLFFGDAAALRLVLHRFFDWCSEQAQNFSAGGNGERILNYHEGPETQTVRPQTSQTQEVGGPYFCSSPLDSLVPRLDIGERNREAAALALGGIEKSNLDPAVEAPPYPSCYPATTTTSKESLHDVDRTSSSVGAQQQGGQQDIQRDKQQQVEDDLQAETRERGWSVLDVWKVVEPLLVSVLRKRFVESLTGAPPATAEHLTYSEMAPYEIDGMLRGFVSQTFHRWRAKEELRASLPLP